MTPVNSYLIPVEKLVPAGGGVDFKDRSMKWAQPSLEETKRLMRHVFTHREEAKKVGLRAEQDVHTLYTQDRIARQILERLANIMERHKL